MRYWIVISLLFSSVTKGQNSITYRFGKETRLVLDTLLPVGSERFVLDIPPKFYGGSPVAWLNGHLVASRLIKRQINTLRPPGSWIELLMANQSKMVEIEVDEGKTNLVSYTGIIMPIEKEANVVMLKTDNQTYEFIDISRIVHFDGPNLLTDFAKSESVGIVVELQKTKEELPLRISVLLLETSAKAQLVLDTTDQRYTLSLQAQIKLPWVMPFPSSKVLEFALPSGILSTSADSLNLKEGEQNVILIPNIPLDTTLHGWKLTLKGQDPFKPNPLSESYPEWEIVYQCQQAELLEDLNVVPKSYEWEVSSPQKGLLKLSRIKRSIYATEPLMSTSPYKSKFRWQGKKYDLHEISGNILIRNTESDTASILIERRAVYDKAMLAISRPDEEAPSIDWALKEQVLLPPKSIQSIPYKYYLLKPLENR